MAVVALTVPPSLDLVEKSRNTSPSLWASVVLLWTMKASLVRKWKQITKKRNVYKMTRTSPMRRIADAGNGFWISRDVAQMVELV